MAFVPSDPFLLEGIIGGLTIGGFTIGGRPSFVFLTEPFAFASCGLCVLVCESPASLAPTSEEAFLFFENIPLRGLKKLLARLPASLAAGVGGAEDVNAECMGADFVLEGGLIPVAFVLFLLSLGLRHVYFRF